MEPVIVEWSKRSKKKEKGSSGGKTLVRKVRLTFITEFVGAQGIRRHW
jgi:hypothetical protein